MFRVSVSVLLTLTFLGATACGPSSTADNPDVILATSTSTYDSGLLDRLIPDFEARTRFRVKPIAVGTGKALAMAERGEADVLLVHSPAAERELVKSGAVLGRSTVMHNTFTIVGPPSDPAGVRGQSSVAGAMRQIAESRSLFISRGDESGTHKMELSLWAEAGIVPSGAWYQESGQGMGATLGIAYTKSAYTLTDQGTYIALSRNLRMDVLLGGDSGILNTYSVLEVNAGRYPKVNAEGARAFAGYMVSAEAQEIIRGFGVDRFGEALYIPGGEGRKEESGR